MQRTLSTQIIGILGREKGFRASSNPRIKPQQPNINYRLINEISNRQLVQPSKSTEHHQQDIDIVKTTNLKLLNQILIKKPRKLRESFHNLSESFSALHQFKNQTLQSILVGETKSKLPPVVTNLIDSPEKLVREYERIVEQTKQVRRQQKVESENLRRIQQRLSLIRPKVTIQIKQQFVQANQNLEDHQSKKPSGQKLSEIVQSIVTEEQLRKRLNELRQNQLREEGEEREKQALLHELEVSLDVLLQREQRILSQLKRCNISALPGYLQEIVEIHQN